MKFNILNIKEERGKIIIEFETEFGIDKFRTDIKDKYKDLLTGKPVWLLKLSNFIRDKYQNAKQHLAVPKDYKSYIGKELSVDELPDTRPKNVMTLHQQSISQLKSDINKHNKIIKDLVNEHHALVKKKRALERDIAVLKYELKDRGETK